MIDKKYILGVGITNATKEEILEYIVKSLENFKKKYFIVTPNPEFLVLASGNKDFKNILNRAELASNDGIGITIAAKILGKSLNGRFAGVDLVEGLCKKVVRKPITVGFLGGRSRVAEKTAECLQRRYPELQINFIGEEWNNAGFVLADQRRSTRIKEQINADKDFSVNQRSNQRRSASIDILFVAFGAPKQEFWIDENLEKVPVKISIGVGGAFDYISGKTPRAPLFLRSIGFEWLFRLIVQPWRIKRQLSLIKFIWLVIKEKVKKTDILLNL